MTLTLIDLIPIFLVFILYFFGMPIVYALFGSTFFYFLVIDASTPAWTIMQKVMNSTQSFSMLAIPFFVMSGSVMNFGGISDKLMDFCECVTGHMRGGLAQVNVLLSMLMGGCSGSANADCAMQSKMLVPEMEKRGYSKAFICGDAGDSARRQSDYFHLDCPSVSGTHLCSRLYSGDFNVGIHDDYGCDHCKEEKLSHDPGKISVAACNPEAGADFLLGAVLSLRHHPRNALWHVYTVGRRSHCGALLFYHRHLCV